MAAEVELPWRALRSLSAHLTERDRRLLRLLAELRLLTTWQIAAVEFGSAITARHRMQVLTGLKVVHGFRPRVERGSSPMHYVLAQLGAAVVAEERPDATRDQVKALFRRVRADHKLAIAPVTALAHTRFAIPIPRDGGIADLLAEAQRPDRRFAAVICESIERVARRTYFGTKIEYELEQAGVALCARTSRSRPAVAGRRRPRRR